MDNIDLATPPTIYRTSNPEMLGKLCIDFAPDTTPTVGPFDDLQGVEQWLVGRFGSKTVQAWFPHGVREA